LANYEHPERSKDGSLLQLMNKAGFETYWISNQNPIGTDETLITTLSKAAAKSYFTNTAGWRKSFTPYDEKLLIPLKKVLSEKKRKKFIILHLMGTHSKYSKRYPESFKQFNTTPITAFKHEVAFNLINEYDNAVLYNDQIVSKVIDLVRNENENAWVLYFSDHGEDVFETIDATSHRETGGTKPMYDIPFVFWVSEKYKQQDKDHIYQSERKFMTDDLIYTIADMSNVHFTEFDSTRSLINPNFIHRKRKINEKEDYDEKFSNN
jgi:heptose-I-phosphate ethanolaminephosphotransferase